MNTSPTFILRTKLLATFILVLFSFTNLKAAPPSSITISTSITITSSDVATYTNKDIVINSGGTLTINSDVQINSIKVNGGGSLIVNSPNKLIVGNSSSPATSTVVDFQNNSIVNVKSGAFLVVYGNINNSNNSTGIIFDGTITVKGDISAGNGSVMNGSGTMDATGTVSGGGSINVSGECHNSTTPAPTASASQSFCYGKTISNLTANGTAIKWYNQNTGGTLYYGTELLANGSYYASQTSSSGCGGESTRTQVNVTINALPTISGALNVCVGSTTSLTGSDTAATSTPWASATPSAATVSSTGVVTGVTAGSSTITYTNSNGCSQTATVTINAIPTAPTIGTITQPTCGNTTGTFIIDYYVSPNTTPGYSYPISSVSGTTTGVSQNGSTITAPIGVYTVRALYQGCFSSASASIAIVQPTLSTPILSVTQPTGSVSTGTITISTPIGSDITYSKDGINYQASNIFNNLTTGTYNITAKSTNGCTSATTPVTLIAPTAKTWTGSKDNKWFDDANWTPSGVPTEDDNVIIANTTNKPLISNTNKSAYAYTITVNSNSKLEIAPLSSLTVTDKISVIDNGIFLLQNSAGLIQTNNDVANSGNITVIRNTSPTLLFDYTYWSSPTCTSATKNQTLYQFSPNSNPKCFLSYENKWNYLNPSTTYFEKGIGYAIIAPKKISSTKASSISFQFTGIPNNGDIPVHVAAGTTSKLVGNPYPSAISADKFIEANLDTMTGTISFWTHSQNTSNSDSSSNYATYNLTGGVGKGIAADTDANSGHGNHTAPGFYIASGQGFIVETKGTDGNITFKNSMRVGVEESADNSNFYRIATNESEPHQLEKHRIWLNLTDKNSNFKQILLGYVENATNQYDPGFDGSYDNADRFALYSLMNNKSYTIQAKGLPFNDSDIFPIGFKTEIKGEQTISIDNVDGLFSEGQNIYIEDKLTNSTHNLSLNPYTFTTEAGVFNDRFIIKYKDNSMLGMDTFDENQNSISINTNNHVIDVKCESENIQKVFIYDMIGRQIFENSNVNNYDFTITNLSSNQVYIVKAILANGQSYTKKVIN